MKTVYTSIIVALITFVACTSDKTDNTSKEGWTPIEVSNTENKDIAIEESKSSTEVIELESTTEDTQIIKYNEKTFKFEGFTFEGKPVDITGKISGFEFREFKIYSTSSQAVELSINAAHTSIQFILLKEKEELAHDATRWKGVLEPGKKHVLKLFHDVDAAMAKTETPYSLEFR